MCHRTCVRDNHVLNVWYAFAIFLALRLGYEQQAQLKNLKCRKSEKLFAARDQILQSCAARCERKSNCKYFSLRADGWCIGCSTTPSAKYSHTATFKIGVFFVFDFSRYVPNIFAWIPQLMVKLLLSQRCKSAHSAIVCNRRCSNLDPRWSIFSVLAMLDKQNRNVNAYLDCIHTSRQCELHHYIRVSCWGTVVCTKLQYRHEFVQDFPINNLAVSWKESEYDSITIHSREIFPTGGIMCII